MTDGGAFCDAATTLGAVAAARRLRRVGHTEEDAIAVPNGVTARRTGAIVSEARTNDKDWHKGVYPSLRGNAECRDDVVITLVVMTYARMQASSAKRRNSKACHRAERDACKSAAPNV
jgi:hypothetical protein